MADTEIERRTIISDAEIEERMSDDGSKTAVVRGYAAVFRSESRNLGGFVETIHPNAFDQVLATRPDVLGVFNHDKNLLLGRTSNDRLRLWTDEYGLRYEIEPNPNTSIGRDVIEWVRDRTVVGSSFAFAISRENGDAWTTNSRGMRHREVRNVGLLEDVGPVSRPAYDSSSVVVSRRCIELSLGDNFRPNQTMANAARKALGVARQRGITDERLIGVAQLIAERAILSTEDVEFLASVHRRCHEVRSLGWSGTPAWTEWMLAGGDSGEAWIQRRAAAVEPHVIVEAGKNGQMEVTVTGNEARAEPGELAEGDFAAWDDGVGRVEHVMTDGELQGMEASEASPLVVLTPYEDGDPEDYMVAKTMAELTKVDEPTADDDEMDDESEDRAAGDKSQSTPAPKEDQISGSDKNPPGSAKSASGRIKVSETTRKALQRKVIEHNAVMREGDRPDWARTNVGQLLAVYRRGAGAYSVSHRPGVSRQAWAMARVNAYLYLLRNGDPQDSKYVTDNDLLPSGHPRSTRERSEAVDVEERAVNLRPSAGMASAARRGLRLHEEGKSGDGLKPETVARANKIARREELTADHVREMNAWFARHEKASKSPGWDAPGAEKPGFVAWLLWGGNPAQGWASRKVAQMERESQRSAVAEVEVKPNETVPEPVVEAPPAAAQPEPAPAPKPNDFDMERSRVQLALLQQEALAAALLEMQAGG